MKIAAICCTYKRPVQLANALACFLNQDYPAELREMIILDDAGQYDEQVGEGWSLVSTRQRFRTLGEKRNATAALVSPDVDAYCVWDDDDAYLPWHLSTSAAALAEADYTIPTRLLTEDSRGRIRPKKNIYLFHGAWAFRRTAFEQVGGYPFIQSGQDQGLLRRLKNADLRRADPIQIDSRPSYIYRWYAVPGAYHISSLGRNGYARLVDRPAVQIEQLRPKLEKRWLELASAVTSSSS